MGKFYENLDTLNELVKKLDKKDKLAYFILSVITFTKDNPNLTQHEIIKAVKKNVS